jgi:hypothetical protein
MNHRRAAFPPVVDHVGRDPWWDDLVDAVNQVVGQLDIGGGG